MRREEDRQLWDLLGRGAPPPRVSEFFARNVVRKTRQQTSRFERLQSWLNLRRLIPATVALALVVGSIVLMEHPFARPRAVENTPEVVAKIDPQDFEVVADLDVLLASDETSLWDDNQSL